MAFFFSKIVFILFGIQSLCTLDYQAPLHVVTDLPQVTL